MRKPLMAMALSALLPCLMAVCSGAFAAPVHRFNSDRTSFEPLDDFNYTAELPALPADFRYDERSWGEIWVKQRKVKGDLAGENIYLDLGDSWHPLGTMDPGRNGWQKFSLNLDALFDPLQQGLALRFEKDGDGFAVPREAAYRLFGISQVPIPAAAWLLAAGLLGLVGIRRKFKNR